MAKSIEQSLKMKRQEDSSKWLRAIVGNKLKAIPNWAFAKRRAPDVFIGGMFVYGYDPKHKDKLPWYDTLPVVIPIGLYKDGWLGLNLHYVPPIIRARILDTLMEYHRRAHTRRAYMKLSYQMLSHLANAPFLKDCIHRYLASHVTTPLLRIEDEYWEKVAMLPIQQFRGARASTVWASNKRKHRRR